VSGDPRRDGAMASNPHKRPESVLVVVYTRGGKVLLLKRVDHADFWQSVTGSMNWDEHDPRAAAARELHEETGIAVAPEALRDLGLVQHYPILPEWRYRYAPGVSHNTERAFALELPEEIPLVSHPEHCAYGWFEFAAAAAKAASWTNRAAIEHIARSLRGS
jgi:dATP pyrophosphohydrolase